MASARRWNPFGLFTTFPGTFTLLALLIAFFILEDALGGTMDGRTLARLGALRVDRVGEHWEVWRTVTSTFLHYGIVHLGVSLLVLFHLGPMVEGLWGTRRMFWFFLLCGVFAALTSTAFGPSGRPGTVGSSGALFGFAGLILGVTLYGGEGLREELAPLRGPLLRGLLVSLAIGTLLTQVRALAVDNYAHLGGLLAGLLLAAGFPDPQRHERAHGAPGFVIGLSALATSTVLMAVDGPRSAETYAEDLAALSAIDVSERPGDILAITDMVARHADAGLADEGRERLDRALRQVDEPSAVRALFASFYGQDRNQHREEALAATAERWLALAPDDANALNSVAWFLVTRDVHQRDPLRAETLSRRSLDRIENPSSRVGKRERSMCLDTLAESLFLQGRYVEARDVQREAVTLAQEVRSPVEDLFYGMFGWPTSDDQLRDLEQRLHKIEERVSG